VDDNDIVAIYKRAFGEGHKKLRKELAQSTRLSHPIGDGSIHNLSARVGDHGLTLEELRDEVGPINII
jgi:hypothetical protein